MGLRLELLMRLRRCAAPAREAGLCDGVLVCGRRVMNEAPTVGASPGLEAWTIQIRARSGVAGQPRAETHADCLSGERCIRQGPAGAGAREGRRDRVHADVYLLREPQ